MKNNIWDILRSNRAVIVFAIIMFTLFTISIWEDHGFFVLLVMALAASLLTLGGIWSSDTLDLSSEERQQDASPCSSFIKKIANGKRALLIVAFTLFISFFSIMGGNEGSFLHIFFIMLALVSFILLMTLLAFREGTTSSTNSRSPDLVNDPAYQHLAGNSHHQRYLDRTRTSISPWR